MAIKKNEELEQSIVKLVVISIVIPLLSATGILFSTYLLMEIWDWKIYIICGQTVIIPAIVTWLKGLFDKGMKKKEDEINILKDEKRALEISNKLMDYELLHSNPEGYSKVQQQIEEKKEAVPKDTADPEISEMLAGL